MSSEIRPELRGILVRAAEQLELVDHVWTFGTIAERRHAAECRKMAAELRGELNRELLARQLGTGTR